MGVQRREGGLVSEKGSNPRGLQGLKIGDKGISIVVRVKESNGKQVFQLPPLGKNVVVAGDEADAAALRRRVYMEGIAPVLRTKYATYLRKVIRSAEVAPGPVPSFSPGDALHITPLGLRRCCQHRSATATRVGVVRKVYQFNTTLLSEGTNLRTECAMFAVDSRGVSSHFTKRKQTTIASQRLG